MRILVCHSKTRVNISNATLFKRCLKSPVSDYYNLNATLCDFGNHKRLDLILRAWALFLNQKLAYCCNTIP